MSCYIQLDLDAVILTTCFTSFLVNTSGSGKTRLLFEGLCRYWGIYFTAVVDTSNLGSNDITATYRRPFLPLPPRSPGSSYISPQVQVNQKTARRVYSEVLLARLLVFRLFASIASDEGEISEHHKQRWLLLQLRCSQLLDSDIFMTITKHLGGVDDAYIDEEIPQLLKDITKWCCSMPSGRNGLFIALDETNYAAKQHYSCFTDAGATYPILKEILRTWRERTKGADVTMVIAGTEIPRSIFKYESGEWDGFHWCSDTGGFDDEKSHERYISPYLPPSFRDSESGKDLIRRMWAWLRGRLVFSFYVHYEQSLLNIPTGIELLLRFLLYCFALGSGAHIRSLMITYNASRDILQMIGCSLCSMNPIFSFALLLRHRFLSRVLMCMILSPVGDHHQHI